MPLQPIPARLRALAWLWAREFRHWWRRKTRRFRLSKRMRNRLPAPEMEGKVFGVSAWAPSSIISTRGNTNCSFGKIIVDGRDVTPENLRRPAPPEVDFTPGSPAWTAGRARKLYGPSYAPRSEDSYVLFPPQE